MRAPRLLATAILIVSACTTPPADSPEAASARVPTPSTTESPVTSEGTAPAGASDSASGSAPDPAPDVATAPANPWADRELPFEPSDADRPNLGTGFTGYHAVPAETGFTQGVRVAGVQSGQALAVAGLRPGDIIVAIADQVLDGPQDELITQLRAVLSPLPPDSLTTLSYYRQDEGITDVEFWLGRSPPSFADRETPLSFFSSADFDTPRRNDLRDGAIDAWVAAAVALDGGEERLADTVRRQRERFSRTDAFRLRETVVAQIHPTAQENLAAGLLERLSRAPLATASIAAGLGEPPPPLPDDANRDDLRVAKSWDAHLDVIEAFLVPRAEWLRAELTDWTPEERVWLAANLPTLTERAFVDGEYLYGDEDVERERTNRRIVAMLERVDRPGLDRIAQEVERFIVEQTNPLLELAYAEMGNGLLAARDTSAGRIEIWGAGNQRHTKRCLFRLDAQGDDNYLDTAGRADLDQSLSINIDAVGDDLYGATTSFCQGAALAGIGILHDFEGNDQYVARQWCQGAAVAGVGWLLDSNGDDTYRGREVCQGVALVGGATLSDGGGNDMYTADRFSQGVGLAGGVGALLDRGGDDHYACTGLYGSEYGEDGLFSGWGQGVGFGFRNIASGGIGILHDGGGDDVYEAGNFSQGGAYFYAWGILRDDAGADRYIGSRYAQGYAAHQAAGTFVDGGGDDLYQSHSSVAQGLSWDETSVFFRDHGGNDRYETGGFSLASAAHNGMVVFIDDAGDDHYAELPAKASSNNYHGGHSFALFVDRAGRDTYRGKDSDAWNGRVHWRHDGAYILDLDGDRPLADLVREKQSEK